MSQSGDDDDDDDFMDFSLSPINTNLETNHNDEIDTLPNYSQLPGSSRGTNSTSNLLGTNVERKTLADERDKAYNASLSADIQKDLKAQE